MHAFLSELLQLQHPNGASVVIHVLLARGPGAGWYEGTSMAKVKVRQHECTGVSYALYWSRGHSCSSKWKYDFCQDIHWDIGRRRCIGSFPSVSKKKKDLQVSCLTDHILVYSGL